MKITLNIEHSTPNAQRPERRSRSCHSMLNVPRSPTRHAEQGIALVITLILLSVTLVMAIAFLAISRRETGSVTTSTDTITARYAADAALANAQAQIVASVLAASDPYSSGLLVSTNFINGNGFVGGNGNPTNVNYDFVNGGGLYTARDFEQNVANLLYLPRAPVFVPNPTNPSVPADFRFYLDLNRNGQFETNGLVSEINRLGNPTGATISEVGDPEWVGVLERPDVPHGPNNKFVSRYAFVAVPADGSLDLNAIHNQTKTTTSMSVVNDGFFRNQGVGSWEINLAAFLADLNTNLNEWGNDIGQTATYYRYNQPGLRNQGNAFADAQALLAYRYANNYNTLAPVGGPNGIFTTSTALQPFQNNIDSYSDSTLMTTPAGLNGIVQNIALPWAGAENTNHFFYLSSDLFNRTKNSPNFTNRLAMAGNGVSTYDRYTFYRMLAQLGTDSAPAQNQVNLNYSNAVATFAFAQFTGNLLLSGIQVSNVTYFANAQTNLTPWQPLQFFTIVADRLLREYSTAWFQSDPTNYLITYYGITPTYPVFANGFGVTNVQYAGQIGLTNQIPSFGITNIPVLANGQFVYTPAVQRVLQLTANIYDATTNRSAFFGSYGKDYPSVFRPIFYKTISFSGVTNVSIVGFQDVASYFERFGGLAVGLPPLDSPLDVNSLPTRYTPHIDPLLVTEASGNVYGVPWIIGAKKGFPNFNEFSMQDVVKVTRKLQVARPTTNSPPSITNQMYVISVTNSLGVEFWNCYTNGYTNLLQNVQVVVNDNPSMQMTLTNGTLLTADGNTLATPPLLNLQSNFTLNIWPPNAFLVPFATNFPFLQDSAYSFPYVQFYNVAGNPNPTFQATTPTFAPLPQILLEVTNHLQAFILDNNHVIDYVHFSGPGSTRNITAEFQNTNTTVGSAGSAAYYTNLVWSTALDNTGLTMGVGTQIGISDGSIPLSTFYWKDVNATKEIDGFLHFLNPLYASKYGSQVLYATNLAVQAPYSPSAITYEYDTYQANDPMVHYLKSDLTYSGYDPNPNSGVQTGVHAVPMTVAGLNLNLLPDLGKVNARYQPWGVAPPTGQIGVSQATYDESAIRPAFKDPLMTRPDNWDFPADKLPTVGWLGRVHRGTPWQTVYMKASDILNEANQFGNIGTNTWSVWTSDANHFDAVNAAPIQDRLLFDNFSTALNDNATRGQLSVNMGANGPSLASWSAVLSGVVALTNTTPFPQFQPLTNGFLTINPSGPAGTNSAVGQLVNGINTLRAQFKNADGLTGVFEHVGDILAAPQLTEQSSFLNTNNTPLGGQQQLYGISDEVYEWLPQQTLSLLRVPGTPQSPLRYVIYSYGQTLKPAPNGVVTSGLNLVNGSSFGMVTNYQVVAETATRAVVRMTPVITTNPDGTSTTNYNTRIEQFNVLGPD